MIFPPCSPRMPCWSREPLGTRGTEAKHTGPQGHCAGEPSFTPLSYSDLTSFSNSVDKLLKKNCLETAFTVSSRVTQEFSYFDMPFKRKPWASRKDSRYGKQSFMMPINNIIYITQKYVKCGLYNHTRNLHRTTL